VKKILLTGGNGFIGKNILESFLSEKYEIIAPGSFELNLIDTDNVDNYFKDKSFDVVLHAGTKPGHRNAKDPTNLFYSNVRMFENLVRHRDKYGKFINFGSGAIYDMSKNVSNAKEEDLFKNIPKDEHGFCKYIVQKRIENLDNFVDLNIFGIFGKYEDWQIRFISNAICKTLFNFPITLRQNRNFSYLFIDDLMLILEFFIENDVKYKSYNIVPNEKNNLLGLAQLVRISSGGNSGINVENDGYGLDYTGNNSRLKKEFVNLKFTNSKNAVSALYNYYNENINKIDKELLLQDIG
jgi:UDP-glucose 4-epimerase